MNGKKTTLSDFEDSIGNLCNVVLDINFHYQIILDHPPANYQNGEASLLIANFEYVVGKLWALICDTDKSTLSFKVYQKLTSQKLLQLDSTKLSIWRNNLMQHINNESFRFNSPNWDAQFKLAPTYLPDLIDVANNIFRQMCRDFLKPELEKTFDDTLIGIKEKKFKIEVILSDRLV